MKRLYIVDYWVPFPQSEYGGMINLIAEDDEEAFDLLLEEESLNLPGFERNLMENIRKAQKFLLMDDYESGVIEAFTT